MAYHIHIVCVDGETYYGAGGSALTCLEFLREHDHEGSNVSLDIYTTQRPLKGEAPNETIDDPERIYELLEKVVA